MLPMHSQVRGECPIVRLLAQAFQHLWLVAGDDISNGSSISLTLLPNLAPPPPDTGREQRPLTRALSLS